MEGINSLIQTEFSRMRDDLKQYCRLIMSQLVGNNKWQWSDPVPQETGVLDFLKTRYVYDMLDPNKSYTCEEYVTNICFSMNEFLWVLEHVGGFYVPPSTAVTQAYRDALLCGKKELLKKSNVRWVDLTPANINFHFDKARAALIEDTGMTLYLPPNHAKFAELKEYIINVVNTLGQQNSLEAITEQDYRLASIVIQGFQNPAFAVPVSSLQPRSFPTLGDVPSARLLQDFTLAQRAVQGRPVDYNHSQFDMLTTNI